MKGEERNKTGTMTQGVEKRADAACSSKFFEDEFVEQLRAHGRC